MPVSLHTLTPGFAAFQFLTTGRAKPTHVRNLGYQYSSAILPPVGSAAVDGSILYLSRNQFQLVPGSGGYPSLQSVDYVLQYGDSIILDADVEWWALAAPDFSTPNWGANEPTVTIEYSDTMYGFLSNDGSELEQLLSNLVLNMPSAAAIAAAIYADGTPEVDKSSVIGPIANGAVIVTTGYQSMAFDLQVSSVSGSFAGKDIWELQILQDIGGALVPYQIITGHSTGTAYLEIPIPPGCPRIQLNWSMLDNTSGHAYTVAFSNPVRISTQERSRPHVVVENDYWNANYQTGVSDGNANGLITLTNTSVATYPSYRIGAQNFGLLLNSVGSAGATMEFAIEDAHSGAWFTGFISQPATAAAFEQLSCNLMQQHEMFLKTTSTTAQNFEYSQVVTP